MTTATRRSWRISRDTVLFVVGLAGIAYETLFMNAERPTLLILFGAMVGLPAFLKSDERRRDSDKEGTE